jgi:thymidine kinase
MFSGKTTELLKRLDNAGPAHVVAYKHEIDTRYQTDAIVTHNGKEFPARLARQANDIADPLPTATQVVGIDEAHFFCTELLRVVSSMTKAGIHVLVTALNVDSWGNPFPVVQQLMDMAAESIVLDATCSQCGGVAIRTQRLTPIIDGNMIGGAEAYQPRCLPCWTPPTVLAEPTHAESPTNLQPAAT